MTTDSKADFSILEAIIKSSVDVVMSASLDGDITSWNQAAEKVLGYSEAETLGKPMSMLGPPERGLEFGEIIAKMKLGLPVESFETQRLKKDGQVIPVLVTVSPVKDAQGGLVGLSVIDRDISLQKQASLYSRSLIEASLDPFVMISPGGKITDVNEGSIKVTGMLREELIGTDFCDYFTEPEKAREGYQQIFAKGFVTDYPLTIHHKDGTLTDVLYNATVYKDLAGKVLSVFATARDVTVQKKAEALLEEKSRELARSNIDLEQFAYVISHDLKAPLRAVDQLSSWIKEDLKDSLHGETREQMEMLRGRVRRMETMLDDLLKYARAGQEEGKAELIDSAALVREIAASLALPEGFRISAAQELPVFTGEKVPLQQVLRNLIDNALKHHDLPEGRIEVRSRDLGNRWEFVVEDDGPGIPSEFHSKIFVIFQTLKPRDAKEGSGMGLTLIKKIVELQGGTISVDSAGGRGARFSFTWPKYLKVRV